MSGLPHDSFPAGSAAARAGDKARTEAVTGETSGLAGIVVTGSRSGSLRRPMESGSTRSTAIRFGISDERPG